MINFKNRSTWKWIHDQEDEWKFIWLIEAEYTFNWKSPTKLQIINK